MIGASGLEDSFLHLGTKTVMVECPRIWNHRTQIQIPMHENTSLFPWLIARLLPSITIGNRGSTSDGSSVDDTNVGGFSSAGIEGVGVSGAFLPFLACSMPDCSVERSSFCIVSVGRGADSDPGLDFCSRINSSRI